MEFIKDGSESYHQCHCLIVALYHKLIEVEILFLDAEQVELVVRCLSQNLTVLGLVPGWIISAHC